MHGRERPPRHAFLHALVDDPRRGRVQSIGVVGEARALGPLMTVWQRLTGDAPFSRRTVEYLTHPGTYSVARIAEVTGWRPRFSLDEGMERTESWLREQGALPPQDG